MRVPPLETERLVIRSFTMADLDDIHRILDIDLISADFGNEGAKTHDEREQWLQWTVLGYEELARLNQPPYGDTLSHAGFRWWVFLKIDEPSGK